MFGKLKDLLGGKKKVLIMSPASGETVALSAVNDPVFSQETMGKGVAVIPSEGKIFAPADGAVEALFETKHAIAIKSGAGAELLIHVGLDTVKLKGECFTARVKAGERIKAGDLLLEFDLERIKSMGYDPVTPVVVCNWARYPDMVFHTGKRVAAGDVMMEL